MARRGENIRKRKDGRWEGRYIKGRKPDRTAIWGYVYGHTYIDVKKKMTVRKAEVRASALSEQNPTFQELSHNWEGSISLGVKASTITHYQYTLKHYIIPVLGDYRVQELDEYTLERSLLEIITPTDNSHKPLGATMARECLVLVRRICRYAAHLHLMRSLEIDVKMTKPSMATPATLSKSEQQYLQSYVEFAPTTRKLGALLMMQMGLRIGEVCGLQWADFDLEHGVLSIERTVKRIYVGTGQTRVVIQSPKTRSSERKIPIPHGILGMLKQLQQKESCKAWFLTGNESKPVEPRCYRKSLRCYLKSAGVTVVNPHALRHTFATTCLQAGCNIKTLSELLGHASSDITLKRYVHTCWEWKQNEMNRIFQ